MRQAPSVALSLAERETLEGWVRTLPASDRLAVRARVILEAAGGRTNGEIARTLGIHAETVTRWRHRFVVNRLEGIRRDAPRSGARSRVPSAMTDRILRVTLEENPPDGVRWTTRSLARTLQVNHMLVHRVWKAHGLAPGFPRVSAAPIDGRPWVDLVGVYLDAPAAVAVFAVGVRAVVSDVPPAHPRMDPDVSGAHAWETTPTTPTALPGILGRAEEVIPRIPDPERPPAELLVFLRNLEDSSPPGVELHVVFDRPLDFMSERVGLWLRAHPRFRVRTCGPDGSWATTVDQWLGEFRSTALHPESFRGVAQFTGTHAPVGGRASPARGRFSWTFRDGLRADAGRVRVADRAPTLASSRIRVSGAPPAPSPVDRDRPV